MAIAQCRVWLNTHMATTPAEEVASTALAAKMASNDPAACAIGCRLAGETFNLNILEQNIEDTPDNYTRFLVIGKQISGSTGKDKTSFLFLLNHRPGALHKALGALARRNINLTQIESRPMKTRNWEYLFFVDVEGHEQEDQVSNALMEMEEHCVFLKRLGSYPSGNESGD
jgi:chorismate mutase/prephenate dehydratase